MAVTVNGLVSGLDTQSIINALVQAEGNSQSLLKQQQSTARTTQSAYGTLVGKVNALSTAAAAVMKTSAWVGSTATSSSTSVTATATGTSAATLSFDVTALAAAHTLISAGSLASMNDTVASGGSLSITKSDGTTAALNVGGGSLAEVVQAVNASGSGITATAVQTGAGTFKLQLAAATTGAASSFTVSGIDGGGGTTVLTAGSDAKVHIGGTSAAAYDATSSTNTFDKLASGLSFAVSKLETGVTVTATVDGSAVAKQIQSMVDAANSTLSYISTQASWDSSSKTSGPLNGESAVVSLQDQILTAVSGAGAPGIKLTSDGSITFDASAFKSAFAADPTGVAAAYGAKATFAAASGAPRTGVALSPATGTPQPGTYAVTVSAAPVREQWQVATSGALTGHALALTSGASTVSYTPATGETLAQSAANFNTQLATAGVGVTATVSGTNLVLTATEAGAAAAFSVTDNGSAATRVATGTDVAGTIDGVTATGLGNVLSIPSGTTGTNAAGLALQVTTTPAEVAATGGAIGSVTFSAGIARAMKTLADTATAANTGYVAAAQAGVTAHINDLQKSIDDWTTRLASYRERLINQFTAMETSLNTLKNSMNALTGLINSLGISNNSNGGSSSSG